MCFSAGASFGASAALGVVGLLAIKRTTSASQVLFAGIPLILAVQQFTEGVVWLSLTEPEYGRWESGSAHLFLFFAEVLWPVWAPVAIYLFEQSPARRKALMVLAGMGMVVGLYFAYHLALDPVRADIRGHHVHYEQDLPMARLWFSGIFYFIPAVVPLLISTAKGMRFMGISLLVSYVITHLVYEHYVTSVWCFFAAILSLQVLWIVRGSNKGGIIERALKFIHT